jgi:teichoic acid transport system ATP-binding protein
MCSNTVIKEIWAEDDPMDIMDDTVQSKIETTVINVEALQKVYKLYEKPSDRMREALGIKKNLHKDHYALRDINMKIGQGETVGIIGTNGSGKSTLLKIITGVLNPTAGSVKVNGRISALLELGAGFNMEYSGLENVYLNGTMLGFSDEEIKQKLPDILDFADIGDYIHQPVKTYSSGMFVRLAFAVAINIDPEILIVDEALSVGDVFFQAKCYRKFEEFRKIGKTILIVSHDLGSITKFCDKVFLLNQGKLLGVGTPKEMIDAYKRVLVGQYPEVNVSPDVTSAETDQDESRALVYGTKQAIIQEFYVEDERGLRTNAIIKGTTFTIGMTVKFQEVIPGPIFAFSIKNVKGTEICGTNTVMEGIFLEHVSVGQINEIRFTQNMRLHGGEYLLSLGVTGYRGDIFEVYHRLYDVVSISVVSDKDTVGYFDMDTQTTIREL